MDVIAEFFRVNRTIVLFVYGLSFFVMGLAVFLQTRRHSRLRLARDLQWLAAFGIVHGIHEWGMIFVPIQASYVAQSVIDFLRIIQMVLLALSFAFLLIFGAVALVRRFPRLTSVVLLVILLWGLGFALSAFWQPDKHHWLTISDIWSRYLLCLPGSILAAFGLVYQARTCIEPLQTKHIVKNLYVAAGALLAYAFFGGIIVPNSNFPPANVLNYSLFDQGIGVPVQVIRTLIGLVLSVTIIRALEVFEIELERAIEQMEIERIQSAERERIGQEIHDGAIQGVYSASLILESMESLMEAGTEPARRLEQAKNVLNAVNTDLRSYMISLRTVSPPDPLVPSLQTLITNPRFRGLLDIDLVCDIEPNFRPIQTHHILSIVQESLSNTLRHARARHVKVTLRRENGMIVIVIEDNGRGFSIDDVPAGYGLRSIRDRARLLGGQLDITSSPGRGTSVMLVLPEERSL